MTDSPEAVNLKPCPFCGDTRITASYIRDGKGVYCHNCGASIKRFHGPKNDLMQRLANAWNMRTAAEDTGQ